VIKLIANAVLSGLFAAFLVHSYGGPSWAAVGFFFVVFEIILWSKL
jgi:hypothetical protein